jgi:uncharacterized protein
MLHPHTELRFVSEDIGYGIFATQDIPKGTITWVKDQLDRVISKSELQLFTPSNLENFLKYTYRDKNGDYFFCWDLTRYVNHSYYPNSMITGLGFEIAIKDILKGDEITNDYGTFNIIEPFVCANGPHSRESVKPDDLKRFYKVWDEQIYEAMMFHNIVTQPLEKFLTKEQNERLDKIHGGEMQMPSILENYFEDK